VAAGIQAYFLVSDPEPDVVGRLHTRLYSQERAVQLLRSSKVLDAVPESWLRLSRSDTNAVANLGGWLTTVVARVSLDVRRADASRREQALVGELPDHIVSSAAGIDPEHEALLAGAVGPALLVALEELAPAERLAFVLHDLVADTERLGQLALTAFDG
jgi:DNA-directed RNA polymerase specialized sigma24 family protein